MRRKSAILLFGVLVSASVSAEDDFSFFFPNDLDSSVSLNASLGTDASWALDLGASLSIDSRNSFFLGAGLSRSTSDTDIFNPISFLVGAATDPYRAVSGEISYEFFGGNVDFLTHTVTGDLILTRDDWQFTARADYRYIDLLLTQPTSGRTVNTVTGSIQGGFEITYFGWNPWVFQLNGGKYFYFDEVTLNNLESASSLGAISDSAINSILGFLDYRSRLAATFVSDRFSVGGSLSFQKNFIDGAILLSPSIRSSIELSDRWSVLLECGVLLPNDDVDFSLFTTTGMTYSW